MSVIIDGSEYTDLVPYQNYTLKPVDYSPMPDPVESISVSRTEDGLSSVSFSPVQSGYTYSLYISPLPIEDVTEKEPDFVLGTREKSFTLKTEEERPYFFLVTTSNRKGVENRAVLQGNNTNTEPFIVKRKEPPKVVVKLPSIKSLMERNLKYNFYRGRYSSALKGFEKILKRKDISESQRETAYFYMGKCYFYTGKYEKAIRHFILSKSTGRYDKKAELWIERCLDTVN